MFEFSHFSAVSITDWSPFIRPEAEPHTTQSLAQWLKCILGVELHVSLLVSRLQAQTLYIYLEIQTLSNTVVHLLINRDGFTSIWGVIHSVCQSSHIIWHHLTSELKMKQDFNSNNLERPQNISSNFVTEGFQLVTSARWILSRVDSRSAEPRRLLHFCCSSDFPVSAVDLRLSGLFFFLQTLQLFRCFWESQLQRSDSFCVRKPFSHRSDNISTSVLRVTVR